MENPFVLETGEEYGGKMNFLEALDSIAGEFGEFLRLQDFMEIYECYKKGERTVKRRQLLRLHHMKIAGKNKPFTPNNPFFILNTQIKKFNQSLMELQKGKFSCSRKTVHRWETVFRQLPTHDFSF